MAVLMLLLKSCKNLEMCALLPLKSRNTAIWAICKGYKIRLFWVEPFIVLFSAVTELGAYNSTSQLHPVPLVFNQSHPPSSSHIPPSLCPISLLLLSQSFPASSHFPFFLSLSFPLPFPYSFLFLLTQIQLGMIWEHSELPVQSGVDPQADRIWCILNLKSSTWRQQFWWYTWELFTRCGVVDAVMAYSTGYCACNVVY